jgi:hypothetical protein
MTIPTQDEIARRLVQSGALAVRNGSVTVHFDQNGHVRKVEKKELVVMKK